MELEKICYTISMPVKLIISKSDEQKIVIHYAFYEKRIIYNFQVMLFLL